MLNKSIFAKNLTFLRKSHKLKQKELADSLSVSVKTVQRWEDNAADTWPAAPELFKIATALDVDAERLCRHDLSSGKDRNKRQKISRIEAKIETDPLFFAFCHLASSKKDKEIEAWLSLMEVQYIVNQE